MCVCMCMCVLTLASTCAVFGQAMENQSSSALSKYREGEEEEDDDFLGSFSHYPGSFCSVDFGRLLFGKGTTLIQDSQGPYVSFPWCVFCLDGVSVCT